MLGHSRRRWPNIKLTLGKHMDSMLTKCCFKAGSRSVALVNMKSPLVPHIVFSENEWGLGHLCAHIG